MGYARARPERDNAEPKFMGTSPWPFPASSARRQSYWRFRCANLMMAFVRQRESQRDKVSSDAESVKFVNTNTQPPATGAPQPSLQRQRGQLKVIPVVVIVVVIVVVVVVTCVAVFW